MPKPGRVLFLLFGALCLWWAPKAIYWWVLHQLVVGPNQPQDFDYYYQAAQIGLAHGWSHIYDVGLQRAFYDTLAIPNDQFHWARMFVSLPPMAWIAKS